MLFLQSSEIIPMHHIRFNESTSLFHSPPPAYFYASVGIPFIFATFFILILFTVFLISDSSILSSFCSCSLISSLISILSLCSSSSNSIPSNKSLKCFLHSTSPILFSFHVFLPLFLFRVTPNCPHRPLLI